MTVSNRAYSILTVKAVDEEKRIITGIATTPTPDRLGDIVEPLGVSFKNPLPLLWQHRASEPVGTVKFDKPTKDGITFEAKIPNITEPGKLKDRIDEAWQSVKVGLVRAVSIGFRSLEHSVMPDGGWRFLKSEVMELSLVTIPAQADAQIQTIKSLDEILRAASGRARELVTTSPGASGTHDQTPRTKAMKTIAEQIAAFEASRAAKQARMEELMTKSAEAGETLDEAGSEEYDNLDAEVKKIDAHLVRLNALAASNAQKAKVVENVTDVDTASRARAGVTVVRANTLPPGIAFARYARCIGLSALERRSPDEIAQRIYKDDAQVINAVKAAVGAGSTTAAGTWAGNLVGTETSIFADFVEYLRPMTILGKFGTNGIPSLRRVPFRTPLITQSTGGAGYWVGQGKAKPLTKFDFTRTTIEPLKVANIAVVTKETLRDSSPSAEGIIRDQLAAALRERLDIDFIDPDKAASAGVSPASILNGVSGTASSGNYADDVRVDLKALFSAFINANNPPTTAVFVMSAVTALSLSLMTNALGQPEFPGLSMAGGRLMGIPIITSEFLQPVTDGAFVALINASDIYFADDGDITVDMSTEASLQMSDNPNGDSVTPTEAASVVSLWQTNSVGFLAERTVNWARRRASAVAYLTAVNWSVASESV